MKNKKIIFMIIFGALVTFLTPNIILANEIEYSDHISLSHTKQQIKQKYESTLTYNYANSPYKVQPSDSKPYVAGSLQDGVINDTLRRINFYRWLCGMDDVELNKDKMERNQKGAVILSKLGMLTHQPEKPSDMDNDFYKEAYAGCYVNGEPGDTYSGNCASGDKNMYSAIDGYVSDLYNISTEYGAVGHRMSLLYPYAKRTSFGQCKNYNTLSMYYEFEDEMNSLDEDYYAFPSPGYFPVELFAAREYWSVYLANKDHLIINNDTKAQFIYEGKTYNAPRVIVENGYMAVSFIMPNELRYLVADDYYSNVSEVTIDVRLTGVLDKITGDTLTYSYPVKFFSLSKVLNKITLDKTKLTMGVNGKTKLNITKDPTNAVVDGTAKWESTNMGVATVDDNGNVTAKSKGNTTIKVTLDGVSASCELVVLGALKGDLDKNGQVDTADAAIALNLYKYKNATEEDIKIADMDGNNVIDTADAAEILNMFKYNVLIEI